MPQLSQFLSGRRLGKRAPNSAWWDCSKTHSVPTPALLGQEKALSPAWCPQAPQKQQEAPGSRAGQGGRRTLWWPWWHGRAVPSAGGHISGTPALPACATPGKAASNTKMWMSRGQNAPAQSSPGLSHQHRTTISIPHCSQNVPKGSGGEGMAVTASGEAGRAQSFWSVFSTGGPRVTHAATGAAPPLPWEPQQQPGRAVICCPCGFTGHVTAGHLDFPALSN